MITDEDGWCSPAPGQDIDDFIEEFVASRPPLTDSEIAELRTVFRTAAPAVEEAA